ncbi:hypothetical protein QCE62_04435 [Caballeronia sp. LZ033]|nr:hypothetical protein [Caballeronia sp. LZ033]
MAIAIEITIARRAPENHSVILVPRAGNALIACASGSTGRGL